ncbi:hypothetical protein SNE40_016699 [Patella caerulea]|uniref:Cadherin domain-containing protein n=2 Tax=Patella caerulea TaxID=87958 RepID=A0AAN8PEF4_PATCE
MAVNKMDGVCVIGMLIISLVCLVSVRAQNPDIVFNLREEMKPGVFIGNIAVDSGVGQDVAVEEFPYLEYKFLNPNNARVTSLFSINRMTGAMYSTAKVDREKMCKDSVVCHITFDVTIQSTVTSFLRLLSVRVEIDDVNDNEPKFNNTSLSVDIPESVVLGTTYRIKGASDADMSPENSVQSYDLVQPNATFGVQLIKKFDGSTDASLSVLAPLDRESQQVHSILLLAKDGGSPQRTGTLLVNVNVLDANDNAPKFIKTVYNVTVSENTSVDSKVGKLEADDKDSGENANISYRFSPLRSSKLEQLFALNTRTGELTVKSPLQYESGKTYDTIVEASDNGNPPQVSQTTLFVNIIDVGNNPPRLQLNLASTMNSETIFLSEGSKIGTFVGHIKVEDRDPDANGEVNCVCEEDYFGVQKLDGKGYALLINKELDRETTSKHNVTITCHDGGQPSLTSSISFAVIITDMNDNAPQFLQSQYSMNITENVGLGVTVGTVLALDRDLGDNSKFYYTMDLTEGAMFRVNAETGVIATNSNIDREIVSSVTFVVKAVDSQDPSLSGTASVTVRILDVNDNSPHFLPSSLNIKAIETLDPGTVIGKLKATDADEGKNSTLSFAAVENNPFVPFIVYEDGTIRLENKLNRELKTIYEFNVLVQDKGDIPKSTTGRVVIRVVDANDHTPVITFPNANNDTITITSEVESGTRVATIMAYDVDEGENGELVFAILEGNDKNLFEMSPKSGEIILLRKIAPTDLKFHQLKISVKDLGAIRLEAVGFLNIEVVHANGVVPKPAFANGQLYLIITGIVAGVTFVVAIIIVTVIIRMKRNDNRNNHSAGEADDMAKDEKDLERALADSALPNTSLNSNDSGLEFHPVKNGDNNIIFTNSNINSDTPERRKRVSFTFTKANGRSNNHDNKSTFSEESTGSDSGKGCSDDENPTFSLSETGSTVMWQHHINQEDDVPPVIPPRMPTKPMNYQASYHVSRAPIHGKPQVQFLDSFTRKPLQTTNSFNNHYNANDTVPNLRHSAFRKPGSHKENVQLQNSFYPPVRSSMNTFTGHSREEPLPALSYNSLCHSSMCSMDDDQYSTTSGSYTINSDIEDAHCA